MLYTEKEASEKLCCVGVDEWCRASACMAWRFSKEGVRHMHRCYAHDDNCDPKDYTVEPTRPDGVPASWEWSTDHFENWVGWIEPKAERRARQRGYCGHAGKPDFAPDFDC